MKTTNRRLTQVTIAVGALMLATLATATPSFGKERPALTIRTVVVRGNEVTITVVNRSTRTQSQTVATRVPTSRGDVGLTAPVTAAAGQTVTFKVTIPEPVLDQQPLGVVVDDGVPF